MEINWFLWEVLQLVRVLVEWVSCQRHCLQPLSFVPQMPLQRDFPDYSVPPGLQAACQNLAMVTQEIVRIHRWGFLAAPPASIRWSPHPC